MSDNAKFTIDSDDEENAPKTKPLPLIPPERDHAIEDTLLTAAESLGIIPSACVSTPETHPVLQSASSVALSSSGGAYDPRGQEEPTTTTTSRRTVRRVKVERRKTDHNTGQVQEQSQDVSHTVEEPYDPQQLALKMQQFLAGQERQQLMIPTSSVTPRNVAASFLSLPQSAPTTMQQANAIQNAEQTYKRLGTALMIVDEMAERMMSERNPKAYKEFKKKRVVIEAEHNEWAPSLALRQSDALRVNMGLLNTFLSKTYVMSAEKKGWFSG